MRTLKTLLKKRLPAQITHPLRVAKALRVDEDLQALEQLCQACSAYESVAIDVGANVGIYAAVMSRYFKQVLCIEPNPSCVSYLRAVLKKNCVLFDCAVYSREGTAELIVPILDGEPQTSLGTISAKNNLSLKSTICSKSSEITRMPVKVTSLDALLQNNKPLIGGTVRLLKVDVEGHELQVLQSATGLLTMDRPAVVAELEARHGTPVEEVVRFLASYGYRVSSMSRSGVAPQTLESLAPSRTHDVNYVFLPN
jgi:FkbM family methyltransferase